MRITAFTGNQPRHIALIEALARIADEVFAIQECTTVFPGQVDDFFRKSQVMQTYFALVQAAERELFGGPRFIQSRTTRGNVRQLALRLGDLSFLNPAALGPALDSDLFIVFGASYIRGPLCDALVERCAINIHMGVSPYYRGSSSNFWALYDRRPDLVGATIHRLTRGLDSGPILFHAIPPAEAIDPFLLGMKAVRCAHRAVIAAISAGRIHDLPPIEQDRRLEIRYTRSRDFTDPVANEYLGRLRTPAEIKRALDGRDDTFFVRVVPRDAKQIVAEVE